MQEPNLVVTLEALPRRGGIASYIGYSMEAARKLNFPIFLAAPQGSLGADIHLDCDHGQMPLNIFRAGQALRKLKAPVVYLAEPAAIRAALWAWDWTQKQKIRLILHGSEIQDLRHSKKFKELLLKSDIIFTLSAAVAKTVLELEPGLKEKITLTGGAPSPHLTNIGGIHNPKKLLTVARLHPGKGQMEVVEAMDQGLLQGYSYEIVGPSRNNDYFKKLNAVVKDKGLPVHFHGEIDDSKLSLLYAQCGVYVLPALNIRNRLGLTGQRIIEKITLGLLAISSLKNRFEGYGLALLDAAAMGLPVVAYDSGGVREAVQHCKTGLLVPPGDKQALASGIRQIAEDDKLRIEMSVNSLAWASSKSWTEVAEKLFAR